MNKTLRISIQIWIILILLLVSCKNENNSKSVNSIEKAEKVDVVLVNDETTITSIDKKWNVKIFTANKSEIRFGSGGHLSNFESREFYCLEINRPNDTLKLDRFIPLQKQTSAGAHERHLTVFIYDSLRFSYSYITEGYSFNKKNFQFFLSTDLFDRFDNEISIAIDYYSPSLPDFNPFSDSSLSPLILFEDIPISKITEELISNDDDILKANDEWFKVNKLENVVIGEKQRR